MDGDQYIYVVKIKTYLTFSLSSGCLAGFFGKNIGGHGFQA